MYTAILSACFALHLLLGHCRGALEIQVPEVPVVAIFGEDVILNCSFTTDTNFSLFDLSIIWHLTETRKVVHGYSHQQDLQADQADSFVNRTELFHEELEKGNASLLLRHVKIEDEGSFTCFVRIKDHVNAPIMLQLAASYSKPNLHLEPNKNLKPGDEVAITCHSSGGYPQATVQWHDGKGSNITENITTSQVANEEGLFDVSSVIRVTLEPNSTYSCMVRNELLDEETQASATITDPYQRSCSFCSSSLMLLAVLISHWVSFCPGPLTIVPFSCTSFSPASCHSLCPDCPISLPALRFPPLLPDLSRADCPLSGFYNYLKEFSLIKF